MAIPAGDDLLRFNGLVGCSELVLAVGTEAFAEFAKTGDAAKEETLFERISEGSGTG